MCDHELIFVMLSKRSLHTLFLMVAKSYSVLIRSSLATTAAIAFGAVLVAGTAVAKECCKTPDYYEDGHKRCITPHGPNEEQAKWCEKCVWQYINTGKLSRNRNHCIMIP